MALQSPCDRFSTWCDISIMVNLCYGVEYIVLTYHSMPMGCTHRAGICMHNRLMPARPIDNLMAIIIRPNSQVYKPFIKFGYWGL